MENFKLSTYDEYFLSLIGHITSNLPYLRFNKSYFSGYNNRFRMKNPETILQEFIEFIVFELDPLLIPEPYRQTFKTLLNAVDKSPISIWGFSYQMNEEIKYKMGVKIRFDLINWLKNIGHPRLEEVELRWPFLTDKDRMGISLEIQDEYMTGIRNLGDSLKEQFSDFEQNITQTISELIQQKLRDINIDGKDFLNTPRTTILF